MVGGRVLQLLVVVPLGAAGIAGTVAGLAGRGADEAFLLGQANPPRVTTAAVEKLMRSAPDPTPPHDSGATRSRCRAEGRRGLRNPWRCTVRYRSGSVAHYSVTLDGDGSYVARYAGGTATAKGCCLRVPAAE